MKGYIFFMIIFFFLFKTTISTKNQVDIIQETCKISASNDPNVNLTLCLNSFNFIPKAHNSTLKELGVIATTICKYSAAPIRTKIKKILKSKTLINDNHMYLKSCLETCLELYSDAILNLKKSSKAIKSGRYDDASIKLSSVVDAPITCEDGFSEGDIESTLKNENDDFFKHSVIALSIVAILQGLHG